MDRRLFPGSRQVVPVGRSGLGTLPQYRWHASDGQAAALLEVIAPHPEIKDRQARLALELQATKNRFGRAGLPDDVRQRRDEILREMRGLNRRKHLRVGTTVGTSASD